MIEIIHLKIIQEIETQKSMTAAAVNLCLTQSALSHAIRKLEQNLQVSLWRREGKYMQLTQAGQELLTLAHRILPQIEHNESKLKQFAQGSIGSLKIGMECHPCYQWLLKVTSPYLKQWPQVELDVKQKFKFGGLGALLNYEIDILITPDPIIKSDLHFEPVFNYEQILIVGPSHPFRNLPYITPEQMSSETLLTYPVEPNRLDIYSLFMAPKGIMPRRHKTIETTDIILQMVENNRGVTALPHWLVQENKERFEIFPVKLGKKGIPKQLFIGIRKADQLTNYLDAFIQLSKQISFPMST